MSEDVMPDVRVTVESLWGDDKARSGLPGTVDLGGRGDAVVRALRAVCVADMDVALGFLVILRHGNPETDYPGLDFDAPNQPTTDDLNELIHQWKRIGDALAVLRELAPSAFNDDDDDEGSPEPEPEPSPETQVSS